MQETLLDFLKVPNMMFRLLVEVMTMSPSFSPTRVLKVAAASGCTLYQIAAALFRKDVEKPSVIEGTHAATKPPSFCIMRRSHLQLFGVDYG